MREGVLGSGTNEQKTHYSFLKDLSPDLPKTSVLRAGAAKLPPLGSYVNVVCSGCDDSVKGYYQAPGGIHGSFHPDEPSSYFMV